MATPPQRHSTGRWLIGLAVLVLVAFGVLAFPALRVRYPRHGPKAQPFAQTRLQAWENADRMAARLKARPLALRIVSCSDPGQTAGPLVLCRIL